MGNEKKVKSNGDKKKPRSSTTKKKKGDSMRKSEKDKDDSAEQQRLSSSLHKEVSEDDMVRRRERTNTVDIGQTSRRFMDQPPEFTENVGHNSDIPSSTLPITEGTPASEAIKANASVRVTKFDKLTRKLKGPAAKKFIKRAATLRSPGSTRRGKPPRVPHHPIHWKRDQNDATHSYPEEELRAHFVTSLEPISETKNAAYVQQHTKSDTNLGMPPNIQVDKEEEESLHDRRRRKTRRRKKKKKRAYVKGKVIDGKHELYALSIAVMLGLRTSIGMTNGQLLDNREDASKSPTMWLTSDDFMAVEKYAFRPKGGPKTPPHVLSHTFKFKDYSPKAFAYMRRLFGINEYDFLSSVCGNANFIEFVSNAKSGQFFFYSNDGKYMIKTMTNDESKFLRRILPHYFRHCVLNPNTLLVHFFGMYRVKMYHLKRNTKFIIMNTVFDTDKYLDTFYDLKGSITGRDAKAHDDVKKDNDVRRDLPNTSLSMLPEVREKMRKQLESDCAFLSSMKIMDYSMLIGVHHIPFGGPHEGHFDMDRSNDSSVHKSNSIKNVLSKRTRPCRGDSQRNHASHDEELPKHEHSKVTPSFSERFLDQELKNVNVHYCDENFFRSDTEHTNVPYSVAVSNNTPVDAEYDEDDDSYLDGEYDRYSSLINGKQQQFHLENSIEVRKLEAAEQLYWPFQRIFDSLGNRRMVPVLTPVEDNDDRQDSSNSTVSTKWELPEFVSPISNRKDAGLVMDISHFDLPLKMPPTSNDPHMKYCDGKIFYMGIIDILQQFNTRKRIEAQYRRLRGSGWADASCVHPILYADRFLRFFDEYTKQYGTNAIEKKESNDEKSEQRPMLTLEDISDDEDEHVETVVFFDENCSPENKKVEIRSSTTHRRKKRDRKKPKAHAMSSY